MHVQLRSLDHRRRLRAWTAALAPSPLLTNLTSYWKLDESSGTRFDSHGTNHLSDINTVGSGAGKIGNAAVFAPASSERLQVTAANLALNSVDGTTVSAWVKFNALPGAGGLAGIIDRHPDYVLYWQNDGNGWGFYTFNTDFRYVRVAGTPTLGQWYHLIGWYYPPTNRVFLQVDGGTPNSQVVTGGPPAGTGNPLYMGYFSIIPQYANISVDEGGVWDEALSDANRALLYNSGVGTTHPF